MHSWTKQSRRHSWPNFSAPGSTLSRRNSDPLLKVVDLGLAGVVFVAPLVLGGRHDVGRFAFLVCVGVAATAWFARRTFQRTSPPVRTLSYWLLAGAVLVLIAQLAPMPAEWVERLSPRTRELLPIWFGDLDGGCLNAWTTLSLTPAATRLSLAMLTGYGLLFITVAQRIQTHDDVVRFVRWAGMSAGGMALLGLLQWVASNGKFLWFYAHPFRNTDGNLVGAFANRNHFAHFVVLGIPSLAVWLFNSKFQRDDAHAVRHADLRDKFVEFARSRTTVLGSTLTLCAVTVVLTCSRGGAIALLAAGGVSTVALWRAGVLAGRRLAVLVAVAGISFFAVSVIGYDTVTQRLATLTAASLEEVDAEAGRRSIWAANIEAIRNGGLFGGGAGSHSDIYRVYLSDPPSVEYTHAENGYLQIVTENGLPGAVLLLAGIALCFGWCWRALRTASSTRDFLCASACSAALAASAAHALFDFVWYIPACMSLTLLLAACVMRSGQLSVTPSGAPIPPTPGSGMFRFVAPTAVCVATMLSLFEFYGPATGALNWDEYLRVSRAERRLEWRPMTISEEEDVERLIAREAALESMVHRLDEALERSPGLADAHRQLANRLEQLFELRQQQSANPMPVWQIRDAAISSQFATRKELHEWMFRAFGEDVRLLQRAYAHARRAVQLAPLQGNSYVALADLCFLVGEQWNDVDAYLRQAQLVRPYDGAMLTRIGSQLAGRGLNAQAVECWVRAFETRGAHRTAIIRSLAPHWPAAQFVAVFAPKWDAIPGLWRALTQTDDADRAALLAYAHEQAEQETATEPSIAPAAIWRDLATMQHDAGRHEEALVSIRKALARDPDNYAARRAYGLILNTHGRFDEAREQLEWCLGRRPADRVVIAELKRPVRERIAALAGMERGVPTPANVAPSAEADSSTGVDNRPTRLPQVSTHD